MFEFDKYRRSLHRRPSASPRGDVFTVLQRSEIAGISLMLWGEHCIECAAPACYTTCNLYEARPWDKGCRRFAFGTYKNRSFHSIRGYGAEVAFKKWGKLEAFGNTSIQPTRTVLRWESFFASLAPISNLLGRVVHKINHKDKWASLTYNAYEKLIRRVFSQRRKSDRPDAFVLEVFNPEPHEFRLQVVARALPSSISNCAGAPSPAIAPFLETISLPFGYSRHEFDFSLFRAFARTPFLLSLTPEADAQANLVFLLADFVKFKRAPATSGNSSDVKCVVWDLDNTLWDGVLIEGDQVALREGIHETLLALDRRGILLSIASKNDYSAAWSKLESLGVAEFFLYPQIDWLPKSQKIAAIAKSLNIGLEAISFIDDNPFELDEVRRVHPQIVPLHAAEAKLLLSDPRFRGNATAEARQRRQYYRAQISREQAQHESRADYREFLRSCRIVLEIATPRVDDYERVGELVQRTNQLNFSGHKYSDSDLRSLLDDVALTKYVLKCSDKYGAYGTVGFCLLQHDATEMRIRDFMLSCRVQGKCIEQAFFNHLLRSHLSDECRSLLVTFKKTTRNGPAEEVLSALNFEDAGDCKILRNERMSGLACDFIEVNCAAD